MASTAATPLLDGEDTRVTPSARTRYLARAAAAVFLCVGAVGAVVAHQATAARGLDDLFDNAHLGGAKCDGTCPALGEREWKETSKEGSAHVLMLGDSTDKLWLKSFCNELLSEEQRCVSPDECATPSPTFLPNNMQPFVCVKGDHRCEARTCYETPSKHCWRKEEQRAAAACKPPVAEGPSIGFVHLFGADPNYEQNMKAINNEYSVEGLPVKIKDRVKTAIKAFDKYTQRRPIVVVVDVAYWWAGKNLGWWRSWKKDLGTYDKFAGKLNEYKKDMAALVKLLDKEMEKSGRPYVLVGKSNHNRGFEEGTVEFNFIRAMGKAVKAVFEQHGHHFYDWRDVADQAEAKGRWVMVDKLHQGSESNDLQTRAFMKWTEAELGKKFAVSLEKQNEKLAEMEAERAKEQEQEEAEMRRERRRQKREEERAAQKAKDDAEWEAAEEERRQQAAQEAAAKEEEDKQALVKAEEEAMSTLTNIRGYLNTNIANIVGPQRAAAGALGSMDVNIPQRQPSAGQTR